MLYSYGSLQPYTAFYSLLQPFYSLFYRLTGSYNLLQPFYSLLQPSTTFYSTNLTPPLLPSSFFLPDAANSELGQMHFITNVGLYVSFFLPDAANSELGQMHFITNVGLYVSFFLPTVNWVKCTDSSPTAV